MEVEVDNVSTECVWKPCVNPCDHANWLSGCVSASLLTGDENMHACTQGLFVSLQTRPRQSTCVCEALCLLSDAVDYVTEMIKCIAVALLHAMWCIYILMLAVYSSITEMCNPLETYCFLLKHPC